MRVKPNAMVSVVTSPSNTPDVFQLFMVHLTGLYIAQNIQLPWAERLMNE
jgi:hypothetical protein